jgi:serine protease inhibitor
MGMRCLLAALAAVSLLGATPPANYNAFGVAMLQRLSAQSHDANVFISPVSLGVALAMAADGAAGSTRAQMLSALRVGGTNLAQANAALIASLQSNHDATVGIADALWLRSDMPPRPAYVALLQHEYDAQAQALHFGDPSAAQAINAWTKQHTLGLIPEIVDDTSPSDYAYLTNALAFRGNWTTAFSPGATALRPFTDASGVTRNVEMMARAGSFQSVDEPTYRVLRLPYGKGSYAAYVLLPAGNGANALLAGMSGSTLDHLAKSLGSAYLAVQIPRFTVRYGTGLNDVLEGMGMRLAFGNGADFSPMCGCRPGQVAITSVVHKTYVRLDETGTTATAATAVGFTLTAIHKTRTTTRPFIVNKPFVLAIRDERTGALLFIGVINSLSP